MKDEFTESNDTNELENFREQWKAEILKQHNKESQSKSSKASESSKASKASSVISASVSGVDEPTEITEPSTNPNHNVLETYNALEIYVKAVTKEREGNLSEALKYYRQALKLDPTVEHSYKKQLHNVISGKKIDQDSESSSFFVKHLEEVPQFPCIFIEGDYEKGRFGTNSSTQQIKDDDNNIINLLNSFRNLQLDLLPLKPNKEVSIAKLPNELIVCILHQLISRGDVTSLERFAMACKKFFLLSREVSLWRYLCEKAYRDNSLSLTASNTLMEEYVKLYNDDWRKMYIERPRIRLDGVYIAICNYLRPGSAENSWNQPIHLVTYYRYIRFYSDGTCIALLTTNEPINVAKNFGPDYKPSKSFMNGKWELNDNHILMIQAKDYNLHKFTFHLIFDLKSTHRGRNNKLTWIEYYSINDITNERTSISLRNEKAYFFSKVKSYVVVW